MAYNDGRPVVEWDLETDRQIRSFGQHPGIRMRAIVSSDVRLLFVIALVDFDSSILSLWDLETGQQLRSFSYKPGNILFNTLFNPDGFLAVSQAGVRSVVVWDTETMEIVRLFSENQGGSEVRMLDISQDGRTVVSADNDGNALVWDLVSDEILHSFSSRKLLPVFPAISPDGRYLLLGSQDHTVTLWDLETPSLEELREWIELNRHVKELSCSERAQFQIEPLCEEVGVENEANYVPPPALDKRLSHPTLSAQVGENRGELVLGDWDVWLYEGRAGEVLTIRMIAGDPAAPEEDELEMDTFLFFIAPDGSLLASNDDDLSGELGLNW